MAKGANRLFNRLSANEAFAYTKSGGEPAELTGAARLQADGVIAELRQLGVTVRLDGRSRLKIAAPGGRLPVRARALIEKFGDQVERRLRER
jgi:hypothetical protein